MKLWQTIWPAWKRLALKIAKAQTILLLTLFYFTIFGLYALSMKLLRLDPLDKKWNKQKSFWIKKADYKINCDYPGIYHNRALWRKRNDEPSDFKPGYFVCSA